MATTMKAATIQLCPGAKNKELLAETNELLTVRTNLEVRNIGPSKPVMVMGDDGRIHVQRACGKTVVTGNINKQK